MYQLIYFIGIPETNVVSFGVRNKRRARREYFISPIYTHVGYVGYVGCRIITRLSYSIEYIDKDYYKAPLQILFYYNVRKTIFWNIICNTNF